jgi:hypothetical protein
MRHATLIWLVFTLILFVLEPLFVHRWFHEHAKKNSTETFSLVHRLHQILLGFSLLAVFGAVAGVHGF